MNITPVYSPHAIAIREILTMLTECTLAEAGLLCIGLANFIAADEVVRAFAYGARYIDDPCSTGGAGSPDFAEAFEVADAVLRARIALDILWSKFEGDTWGRLGNAIVSADEVLEPHARALCLVPPATWQPIIAAGETFDEGESWWGDVYQGMQRAEREFDAQSYRYEIPD